MINRFFLLVCLVPVLASSCLNTEFEPSEWAIEPQLDFSESTVMFHSVLSVDSVAVMTNYRTFEAKSNQDWCEVSVDQSKAVVWIKVEPNIDVEQRSALVAVTISRGNKSLSKNISVVQMGGIWESVGDFNVYWGHEIGDTQKSAVVELLENMVYVSGGNFIMGNSNDAFLDDAQPHDVTLSSFHIGKYEITQKQWRAVMGYNPSAEKGENIPVYNISWAEALEFTSRLAELTNLSIALPTEAQWEFAAKGGNKSRGYEYSGSDDFRDVAVCNSSLYVQDPAAVGSLSGNELGIYDMSGNVAEYCFDWMELDFVDSDRVDPSGPDSGVFKVVRGGHVNNNSYYTRTTYRGQWSKGIDEITPYTGFRIVINDESK